LIAPNIFNWVAEYPLLIVAGILCRPGLSIPRERQSWLTFALVAALLAAAVYIIRGLGIWPEPTAFQGMIGAALLLSVVFLSRDALRLAGAFACVLVLIYAY